MKHFVTHIICMVMMLGSLALLSGEVCAQHKEMRDRPLLKALRERRENRERYLGLSDDLEIRQDIPYVKNHDPLQTLDIYIPQQEEEHYPSQQSRGYTVLFHVHGGGWKIGDKKYMRKTAVFYAGKNILFVTPNYRLSPQVQHPAHVEDCAAAVAWLMDHVEELGGDKAKIFLSGHSAGAHLVALLGANQKYLKKFGINPSDLAGIIPLDTASFDLTSDGNEPVVKKFIQTAFGADIRDLKDASPYYHLTDDQSYPKFLILNTTNRANAVKGAEEFANRLNTLGAKARFVPVDDHSHGEMATGMYDPLDPVSRELLRFIR